MLRSTFVFACLSLCLACGSQHESTSQVQWGHFAELDRGIDASAMLFGLPKDQLLHVCLDTSLPRGLDTTWLQAEVFSALNIWAQSVGRYIPLAFDGCRQKPALRIVFAKAPISGDFVGYTQFDGERIVYLNPDYNWQTLGTTLGFDKQSELQRASWQDKARFILPLLVDGAYSPLILPRKESNGPGPQATLAILMHEFGHAWGLCDLYEEASGQLGFNTNCSKNFRGGTPSTDEIMSSATRPGTARFGISSLDREGLQTLFKRPGFPIAKGWTARTTPLPLESLLSQVFGAAPSAPAPSEQPLQLQGMTRYSVKPGQKLLQLHFEVTAGTDVESVFVYESRGLGPFTTVTATTAQQTPQGRSWQIDLPLPLEDMELPQTLTYLASVAGQAPRSLTITVGP